MKIWMHQKLLNCSYRIYLLNMDCPSQLSQIGDQYSPLASFARSVNWQVFSKRCQLLSTHRLMDKRKESTKSWNSTSGSIATINKMIGSLASLSLASLTTTRNILQPKPLLSLPTMVITFAALSGYMAQSTLLQQRKEFASFARFMTI